MTKTCAAFAAIWVAAASFGAQAQAPLSFRLDKSDRNPMSCSAGDAAMSRPQSVTIANDVAMIASNGGINDKAKMTKPGVYHTKWSLGVITYDIEINAGATPPTMTVVEPKLGCKWSGQAG